MTASPLNHTGLPLKPHARQPGPPAQNPPMARAVCLEFYPRAPEDRLQTLSSDQITYRRQRWNQPVSLVQLLQITLLLLQKTRHRFDTCPSLNTSTGQNHHRSVPLPCGL